MDFDSFDNNYSKFSESNKVNGRFKYDIDNDKNFNMQNIDKIDVDTVSTDIRFIPEDRDDIKVHFHGTIASSNKATSPYMTAEMVNKTLKIKINHKNSISIGFNSYNLYLDIYIPKDYSKSIIAKTTSGDIALENLDIEDLYLKSTSGDIKSEYLYAKKGTFKSTSGGIKIENHKGEIDAKTTSGDIYINTDSTPEDIYSHSVSGDIKIQLPNNSEFYLESKTTSGEIICEFPIEIKGMNGDKAIDGIVGNGESKIAVSTVSGDVKISKE